MEAEQHSSPSNVKPRNRGKHTRRPEVGSGDDVIKWIEYVCYVPEGKYAGQQVKLLGFQKDLIRKIYDNKFGTRRAIISMGRKNAKTALSAFLLLNHLCGPWGKLRPNSQLYSTAQSREQAAVIFKLACKIVRMSPHLRDAVRIRDNAKELICVPVGNTYRALSAEAATAFGLSPSFVVHDELGQCRGPRSELYEAMETATGAQEDPLTVIISTQAPTDNDLLSILIDDALAGHDPRTIVELWTAPVTLDPFSEATIKLANPALGKFLNKREVLGMAEDARRMPARESEYRNLVLNQRIELNNPFITRGVWDACATAVKDLHNTPLYAGLDLSSVSDLTAFIMMGRIDRVWHVKSTFWLPQLGLREKAANDRVPYDLWASEGLLQTTPGNSISYEYVANYLRKIFTEYDIKKLAFDRWNFKHLKPWLEKAGFNEPEIKEKFVEFGQGTQSMSPALRDLEAAIKEKEIAHGGHKVLDMCASCAVIDSKDPANRKLSKNKSNGRIDGLVALTMAFGVAPLQSGGVDIRSLIG